MKIRRTQELLDAQVSDTSSITEDVSARGHLLQFIEKNAKPLTLILGAPAAIGGVLALAGCSEQDGVTTLAQNCSTDDGVESCVAIDMDTDNGSIYVDGSMQPTKSQVKIAVGDRKTMTIDRVHFGVGSTSSDAANSSAKGSTSLVEVQTDDIGCTPKGDQISAELYGHYTVGGKTIPVTVNTVGKSDGLCGQDTEVTHSNWVYYSPILSQLSKDQSHSVHEEEPGHSTYRNVGGIGDEEGGTSHGGTVEEPEEHAPVEEGGGFHGGGGAESVRLVPSHSIGIGIGL